MRRAFFAAALAACSCSSDADVDPASPPEPGSRAAGSAVQPDAGPSGPQLGTAAGPTAVDAGPAPPPPLFADATSLRLKRSIAVRLEPSNLAGKYGTIAAHTRVEARGRASGPGCQVAWIEIAPFGWICGEYVTASSLPAHGVELPRLAHRALVPGTYAKVVAQGAQSYQLAKDGTLSPARELAGSIHVRRYGEISSEGGSAKAAGGEDGEQAYWLVDRRAKEYVAVADLRLHRPSDFVGVRLGDETGRSLPMVFAVDRHRLDRRVPVYSRARGGKRLRSVPGRSAHAVLEISRGKNDEVLAYRIGSNQWVREQSARLMEAQAPPDRMHPGERWVDVDLTRQVLVAYEGELPVYATLVSTGSRKHATETGIYRIWIKFSETAMSDQMAEQPYSVATVPWTQFYSKDLALHTSYWHDGFGTRRSHGCVNLAPIDSRFVYFWTQPEVPPGWSMAHGTLDRPGSLVRVHSATDPNPPFRGLALEVWKARAP